MLDSLPNEKRKCHRCNFEKSCRELVVSGDCQRWRKNPLQENPIKSEPYEPWMCIDDQQRMLLLEIGKQSFATSVEVNVLRNETAKAHSENLAVGAMAIQRAGDAVRETFTKTLVDFLPEQKMKLIARSD